MISEREKLEFDSLPEFVREPYTSARESYIPPAPSPAVPASSKPIASHPKSTPTMISKAYARDIEWDEPVAPKSAELDTLWPGVGHDFLHDQKKAPSFYLTLGFMAGAIVSLVGVWCYALFNHGPVTVDAGGKKIVVAGQPSVTSIGSTSEVSATSSGGSGDAITPAYPEYEVKTGDTLAAIALHAYHRASPRLLDEICRANDMKSANVLNLGQKLILPVYRPQTSLAGTAQIQ